MQKLQLKHLSLIFLVFSLFINTAYSQEISRLDIEFRHGGQVLKNALTGGLDTPQFGEMDFNNDGIQDLLIFDRVGFLPITFINGGTPNTTDYTYAPAYESIFPKNLRNWVMPRDYNGDGIMDLFAHPSTPGVDGIEVYKGYYDNDLLQFEKVTFPEENFDIIYFPLNSGGKTQLYVSSIDYPAIDDIDGDGDLDIVTFNPGGGVMELYQNQSVEQGFGTDSLIYLLTDSCWGGVYETGISVAVELSNTPGECAFGLVSETVDERHAGSTLLTLDYNGDGVKEMILGDLSFDNLNLLINNGDKDQAWMNEQLNEFPVDKAVDLTTFPVAFYLDINNDGAKDLIACPNVRGRGDNYENVWLYLNNGTTEQPDFRFETKRFLVDEMIDVGSDAHPTFVDVNGDGLLDLIVGNLRLYSRENTEDARLFYYENTGTAEVPVFSLITDDWMGFSDFNSTTFDFAPGFGDLDNDGDLDLLVGDDFGKLFYAENKGGAGNPMVFNEFTYQYMDIDIGKAARPQVIDINGDGLQDLVLGERGGNNDDNGACGTVNYFQNVGSATQAMFGSEEEEAPNTNCLGRIFTIPPNAILSYSAPVFWDFGDHIEAFVGTEATGIKRYSDINSNPNSTYTLVSESFLPMDIGNRLSPTVADINNDGFLDMAVGNARGGLSILTTGIKTKTEVSTTEIAEDLNIRIYPNPAQNVLNIDLLEVENAGQRLEIFNINGQLMHQQQMNDIQQIINVKDWSAGIYVVRVFNENGWAYRKIVIE